jgi:phosphatidylserine/phosphatidylglycerophosphate/cardiolipin synthase-like enzyme
MHNKFAVFDCRKGVFEDDDILWTGSYNLSYYSGYKNSENAVLIHDHNLATIFTTEFDEMWGGSGDTPSEALSRFGTRKYDNTPHFFSFDGGTNNGEIYFAPSDGTNDQLADAISTADYEIYFCIFSFTRDDLAIDMHQRYMWGVDVIGIFDSSCMGDPNCVYDDMDSWGMDVYEDGVPGGGSLHDKYMIIDGFHPDSNPMVVTGSHNWSTSGAFYNDENLIILKDERIANLYIQAFAARLEEAGGHLDIPAE